MAPRLDELSRALASQSSRRGVLKVLGAFVTSAALAQFGLEPAAAGALKKCPSGQRALEAQNAALLARLAALESALTHDRPPARHRQRSGGLVIATGCSTSVT